MNVLRQVQSRCPQFGLWTIRSTCYCLFVRDTFSHTQFMWLENILIAITSPVCNIYEHIFHSRLEIEEVKMTRKFSPSYFYSFSSSLSLFPFPLFSDVIECLFSWTGWNLLVWRWFKLSQVCTQFLIQRLWMLIQGFQSFSFQFLSHLNFFSILTFLLYPNPSSPSSSTFFISWNGGSQGKESHSSVNIVIQNGRRVVDNFFSSFCYPMRMEERNKKGRKEREPISSLSGHWTNTMTLVSVHYTLLIKIFSILFFDTVF